jgi:hypothetical protein
MSTMKRFNNKCDVIAGLTRNPQIQKTIRRLRVKPAMTLLINQVHPPRLNSRNQVKPAMTLLINALFSDITFGRGRGRLSFVCFKSNINLLHGIKN